MRKITFLSILLLCLTGLANLNSQALLERVPLQTQIEKSDLVVEGKVIAKRSVWDDAHKLIYTINTIEVYKVFKGSAVRTVEVITVGGTVGLKALVAHPSLKLRKGDIGVFVLNNNNISFSKTSNSKVKKFKPSGLTQGFYKYNLSEDIAVTPFVRKQNIVGSFYDEIQRYSKSNIVELKSFDASAKSAKNNNGKVFLPPSALTLNKTSVSAGTKDALTITGSGFGTVQGKVQFRNADDGGASFIDALDTDVVSWADDQIVVYVPSDAGTGTIRVRDDNGVLSPESSTLTVLYAEINVISDAGGNPDTAYQVQHVGQNFSGGMTWRMQTEFFDDTEVPGAKAAFMRAFNNWICETGINYEIGPTGTAVDAAGSGTDGTNVIRFDNGSELDSGTLGVCYSYFSGCGDGAGSFNWYVSELDLVFNDTTNWYVGTGTPASGQIDFESIALHELGHSHQLAHIIDPNNNTVGNNAEDVMHYAFNSGEFQRLITVNNSTAANLIQDRSTGSNPCPTLVLSAMTDASCPLSIEDSVLEQGVSIYPNPAKTQLFIKNGSYLTLKSASLYDLSGRNIVDYDISEGSKLKTISLSNVSSGVYFIKIASDEASVTKKLVID
ncbi:T9SS type A sorting domain-containing protein [Hyunsoonleella flava]|uniref:T9SS type A sorting domain-containing protein n=1 Tax=Hyunsoonleella flava TaxID=2527939 RepID=A0A4Q9FD56_9FLAO|nr:T9SS type A sorting domain-containing protein [Hyunsoonleella flava]TBN03301.1 T9SS type A sorting domain-containing protein [Hyunsoonleella flava]